MNPYYYWFFAIYHIYVKCKSSNVSYFAPGMFSILIFMLILDIAHPITLMVTGKNPGDPFFMVIAIISGLIILFNYFSFIHHDRDIELYQTYLEIRKFRKDMIAIIFSISILGVLFFYFAIYDQFKSVFIR